MSDTAMVIGGSEAAVTRTELGWRFIHWGLISFSRRERGRPGGRAEISPFGRSTSSSPPESAGGDPSH